MIFASYWGSPLVQFSKFKNFLWVSWFLGKNLSNFLYPVWKLHNPYYHNAHLTLSQYSKQNNLPVHIPKRARYSHHCTSWVTIVARRFDDFFSLTLSGGSIFKDELKKATLAKYLVWETKIFSNAGSRLHCRQTWEQCLKGLEWFDTNKEQAVLFVVFYFLAFFLFTILTAPIFTFVTYYNLK